MFTLTGVVAAGFVVAGVFNLDILQALLVATPGCLMIGSMITLWRLAAEGEAISAHSQLKTLLIVEFVLVPLGAAVALVAFFLLRTGPL